MRITLAAIVFACAAPALAQTPQPGPELTLPQAVSEAMVASPRLRDAGDGRALATIREAQARAQFGIQVAPAFDTLSDPTGLAQRTMGVTISKMLPTGTGLHFDANTYQFRAATSQFRDTGYSVRLSQPLFRGWTSVASEGVTAARRGVAAAARADDDARQQLVLDVAAAFFEVLRRQRLLDSASRSVERARRLRASSQARAAVGLATELDVLRADLLAAEAEASTLSQQEALHDAVDALNAIVGRPIGTPVLVADVNPDAPEFAPPAESADALLDVALGSRYEVIEAQERIADARRQETVARWNLLPPLTLDLSYTQRGLGSGPDDPWGSLFNGFRWGVSSTYAIGGGERRAAAATAALSRRRAELDREDAERRMADEVRRAFRGWQRTAATLRIRGAAVSLAERQLRLAELRFERGLGSSLDVVDADVSLVEAQTSLVDAELERALAALALRRAAGILQPDRFSR